MTITESLKRFRTKFNLKQKDIAKFLEVTPQAYQVTESKGNPSALAIVKLATAYNVSTDYLLGLSDIPDSKIENPAPVDVEVDDEDSNALTIAAESDRILDYHENLAHVLAKQGIKI